MKSQPITPEVRQAIRKWYEGSGLSQPEMGKLVGLSNQSVNQWLNGRSSTIRPSNWLRLYPYIAEYLPLDFPAPLDDASPPSNPSIPSILSTIEVNGILQELLGIWPKLSTSEQAQTLAFAASALEKSSHTLQSKLLDKEKLA